jgi:hypothetical protein
MRQAAKGIKSETFNNIKYISIVEMEGAQESLKLKAIEQAFPGQVCSEG